MLSYEKDESGNSICADCMCHVKPGFEDQHHCPPWVRELKKKKDRDERYFGKFIANSNLDIPIEYREQDFRDEL